MAQENKNNKLTNTNIAKIDATKNKKIAEKYSVKTFPTIKYVKNGFLGEYTGVRTKDRFSSFLSVMSGDYLVEIFGRQS